MKTQTRKTREVQVSNTKNTKGKKIKSFDCAISYLGMTINSKELSSIKPKSNLF
jgi:hypothetical protein